MLFQLFELKNEAISELPNPKAHEISELFRTCRYFVVAITRIPECDSIRPVANVETLNVCTLPQNSKKSFSSSRYTTIPNNPLGTSLKYGLAANEAQPSMHVPSPQNSPSLQTSVNSLQSPNVETKPPMHSKLDPYWILSHKWSIGRPEWIHHLGHYRIQID